MNYLKNIIIIAVICMSQIKQAQAKTSVAAFNKVIISPHIETTFVQGNEESVTILDNIVSDDKVNVEVKNGTLRVYLDDAKMVTKHKKIKKNGVKMKMPIYNGKVLTIQITYKHIDNLSIRGEQRTLCESLINVNQFSLKIYGESQVVFNEITINKFDVAVYGESQLTIKKGSTTNQSITAYGEGEINLVDVNNKTSKLKAYGEAEFKVNASERINFTAYGEAELYYKGTASVNRGLSFGDSKINQID